MKKIAIIPARSGSKGLKNKNILQLCGKHLMGWTIDAAIKSKCFDRIIVSTDSEEYKKIAEAYGAEVIIREEKLARDSTSTFEVIESLFKNKINEEYDYFVLLQPTSPLRKFFHIIEACNAFEKNIENYDFLVSVKESEHSSDLVKPIIDGTMKYFDCDFSKYRRQDKKNYSPNGAIFIGKVDKYLEQKHFFGEKSIAFNMDKWSSIDIDDVIDFKLAEIVMKENY